MINLKQQLAAGAAATMLTFAGAAAADTPAPTPPPYPAMGATLEGQFDYQHDDVRLRGTFVPAYAINNFLARVPIIGDIIGGGKNEGIFGMTYEVVGPPGNATLRVMPMSVFAPGIFRKVFEFRNAADDRNAVPPYSSPTR